MNKFQPNQRVVLNVKPDDLVHVTCSGAPLQKENIYHIKEYTKPFHGMPMVRLRECGDTAYLESLFVTAPRKRIATAVAERLNYRR